MALYAVRKPNIRKVALVHRPANGRSMILKADGAQVEILAPILKAEGDWKVAYAVIAEPGTPEGGGITADGQVAKGEDGQPISDVWDAESIRAACHSFARNGAQMTAGHFTDDTAGSFVENWIAPHDMEIAGHPVKAGSWVLGLDPSAEMRAAIDSGAMTGFSVEGDAIRELVAHSEPDTELLALIVKAWDEAKHPRAPAGTTAGGKFAAGSSSSPTSAKQKHLADAAAAKARADHWAGVIRGLNASKGSGKAKRAKLSAAKKAHAQAVAAQKAHLSRVKRHEAQHVARLKRHAAAASKRSKAAARAHAKAVAAMARRGRQAQAQAKRDAASAKRNAASTARSTSKAAMGNAKQRAAAAKVSARLGGLSPVVKGIGSQAQEPLGTKPLWNTPGLHLPPGIQSIAKDLMDKGMPESRAIATAIAAVKQGCATGKFGAVTLTAEKRAQACKASADWEKAKAQAKAA